MNEQSINHPIDHPINHPVNQSIIQSIVQSINQSISWSSSTHCSHSLSGWRSPGSAAVHGDTRGEGGSHWKPLQENHRGNRIYRRHCSPCTHHTHHTHHTHTLTRTLCKCRQEGCKCGGWTLTMWRGVCGTWWGWPRNCTQTNHATSELWVCIAGRATPTHTPHTSHLTHTHTFHTHTHAHTRAHTHTHTHSPSPTLSMALPFRRYSSEQQTQCLHSSTNSMRRRSNLTNQCSTQLSQNTTSPLGSRTPNDC